MNRKLYISLAPLIVTAAFAVMPAASQAACTPPKCPHGYVNGVISAEGVHVPIVAWGTAVLKNATLGELECHTVFAGYGENPVGGGASIGKTQAFYPYECLDALCTSTGGTATLTPENLPWVTEVTEPKANEWRLRTGKSNKKEAENIEFFVNCEPVAKAKFFGENSPRILNSGSSIGSKPGQLEFDVGAGALESTLIGKGTTAGKIKVEGYEEEELGSVKNP